MQVDPCVSNWSMASEMYALFVQGGGGGFAAAADGGGGGVYLADPTRWGAWAHRGHRLWASMAEEFWVYVYKVQRCPQPCSHDWTACPYAHRGERARRRDPRRFNYVAVSCPDYRVQVAGGGGGQPPPPPCCVRGLKCRYAHGVFELWLHPSRFRTRMCEAGTLCPRPICFFAHSAAELRREDASAAVTAAVAAAAPRSPYSRTLHRAAAAAAAAPPRDHDHRLHLSSTTSLHATALDRSFRVYYPNHAVASSSSPAAAAAALPTLVTTSPDVAAAPAGARGSRCAEEEDSMVHDYPHVDLIMDLVR